MDDSFSTNSCLIFLRLFSSRQFRGCLNSTVRGYKTVPFQSLESAFAAIRELADSLCLPQSIQEAWFSPPDCLASGFFRARGAKASSAVFLIWLTRRESSWSGRVYCCRTGSDLAFHSSQELLRILSDPENILQIYTILPRRHHND